MNVILGIFVLVVIILRLKYHTFMFDGRDVNKQNSIPSLIENPSTHLV